MEKKAYIIPALKTLSVNEEQLLLTVSISDGTNNIDDLTDGGDGDAGVDD